MRVQDTLTLTPLSFPGQLGELHRSVGLPSCSRSPSPTPPRVLSERGAQHLEGASVDALAAHVAHLADLFEAADADRDNWGLAKSTVAAMLDEGVDLEDPAAVDTGVTFARLPSQPGQERCRQIFLARWPDSDHSSQQSAWCHMILLNAEALRRAGPQLTLQTWSRGFASLGTYQGNHVGRGRFAPDKYDGADQVQVLRYLTGTMSSASPFVDGF